MKVAVKWLPASMPAAEYFGHLYASNGRTAFRVKTKLARADRRIPQKDSRGAFGKKRMPKIALPKVKSIGSPDSGWFGPKRVHVIDGHSYDARHALCVFDGKGLVAAVASLRGGT